MVSGASRRSIRPKESMLTEEKAVAIVPWQEMRSESEVFVFLIFRALIDGELRFEECC